MEDKGPEEKNVKDNCKNISWSWCGSKDKRYIIGRV